MLDKETYNDYTLGIARSPMCKESDNPKGTTKFNGYRVDKTKKAGILYMWVNGKRFVKPT
tara:strand:- start:85 stop:264 length:180 start_codon:yes stop_codon:yes gene_type:complete